MTRPESAIGQVAVVSEATIRANTHDHAGRAHYPVPQTVSQYPTLLLFWGETAIDFGGGEQYWIVTARGQLLMAKRANTPSEIARADNLIVPLVDAFAPGTTGYRLESANENTSVDFCRVERVIPSLIVEYGGPGVEHYAAELYWRMKLRRFTGGS